MSLERKTSSLFNWNSSSNRRGKDFSRFGTIFKTPNPIHDLERKANPVDEPPKSKINKTVPVHMIPQQEPVKKEEIVVKNSNTPVKINNFSSGSKSTTKL